VRVLSDGKRMLKRLIEGRWLQANGVLAFYPANTVNDDDIEIYTDETRTEVAMTWHGLRQQTEKQVVDGVMRPSRCLADFIAPKNAIKNVANVADNMPATGKNGHENVIKFDTMYPHAVSHNAKQDYIGLFAVTAGIGAEKKEKAFQADLDDYSSIMLKALADRLAEAFAECLHHRVRTDLWGYAPDEALSNDDMIAEKYKGIRPAPGYPACPDHSVKADMFKLLQCDEIGMSLTESLAMLPAASVSGFIMAHPEATYFNVGKIGDDQLKDMVARRGANEKELSRLLAPNL
jgi:5-methyltetrahydrofolate--homocysteine methyltransferase